MESPAIAAGSFEELIALSWFQIAFPCCCDSSNKNWTMSNGSDEFRLAGESRRSRSPFLRICRQRNAREILKSYVLVGWGVFSGIVEP
jgi:hypothetical protein